MFGGRGEKGNQFRVWDFEARAEVPAPADSGGILYSFFWNLSFTADGRLLAVGGPEGRVWHTLERRLLRTIWHTPPSPGQKEQRADSNGVISRDGKWAMVFGRETNRAAVWDLQQPTASPVFLGGSEGTHKGELIAAAFHPQRPVLATASADGTVRLWSMGGRRFVPNDLQHESAVETIDFSPDGELLATGTRDGLVRVWSVQSGEWTGALWVHDGPVTKVAFSPKGRQLVSASRDQTARVCTMPEEAPGGVDSLLVELELITGITVIISTDGTSASFSPPRPLSAEEWTARHAQRARAGKIP